MPFTFYSFPWDQAEIRFQQSHIFLCFFLCSILLPSFPYRFLLKTLLIDSLAQESSSQAIFLKLHSYLRQSLTTLLFRQSPNPSMFISTPYFCLKLQCLESQSLSQFSNTQSPLLVTSSHSFYSLAGIQLFSLCCQISIHFASSKIGLTLFFKFYWSIFDLQCCISFRYTAK